MSFVIVAAAPSEQDLLLSGPIYTDAAINPNMLCPSVIPSMGGQEFVAKQRGDQTFDQSQRENLHQSCQFRLLILPYDVGHFAPTHQNKA